MKSMEKSNLKRLTTMNLEIVHVIEMSKGPDVELILPTTPLVSWSVSDYIKQIHLSCLYLKLTQSATSDKSREAVMKEHYSI